MNEAARAVLASVPTAPTAVGLRLAFGKVTSTSPLQVALDGSLVGTPVMRCSTYTPTLNDFVAVLVSGSDRLLISKVV